MEYLAKKGYSRTELMLRAESANRVGRAVRKDKDEKGFVKYFRGFGLSLLTLLIPLELTGSQI